MKTLWSRKCEDCGMIFAYEGKYGQISPWKCEKCRTLKNDVELSANPPATDHRFTSERNSQFFRKRAPVDVVDQYQRTVKRSTYR